MHRKRSHIVVLLCAIGAGTAGCSTGYGYEGFEYGQPYYDDGYGYGGQGGYYGHNVAPAYYGADRYYGWYGDYYYPGAGTFVYDQARRPRRWTDAQRTYWRERHDRYWRGRGLQRYQPGAVREEWRDFDRGGRNDADREGAAEGYEPQADNTSGR